MAQSTQTPQPADLREGLGLVGLMAASRVTLLLLLGWLVKGKEFTDDVFMHMARVRAPFQMFTGVRTSHQPPLLGVFEAPLAYPLQMFVSDFYAIRITYLAYETLAAWFFWLALRALLPQARERRRAAAAFVLLPIGWMTSVVMAQDEVVATAFLAAVLWLLATRRLWAALAVCSLAVLSAKIFMMIPLVALVLLLPVGNLVTRGLAAFVPIGLVYAWTLFALARQHQGAPLADFTPNADFGVNGWVLLPAIPPATARTISSALAVVGGMVPLALAWLRPKTFDVRAAATLFGAMFFWVLFLFYHVNPDYYLIVYPALLLVLRSRTELALAAAMATAPYAVNFFYGVDTAERYHTHGGKEVFVKIYQMFVPVAPALLLQIALWATTLLTLAIALELTRRVAQRPR